MDGRRTGPLNRGELGPDEDVLSQRALDLGVRSFLKREEAAGGGENPQDTGRKREASANSASCTRGPAARDRQAAQSTRWR